MFEVDLWNACSLSSQAPVCLGSSTECISPSELVSNASDIGRATPER